MAADKAVLAWDGQRAIDRVFALAQAAGAVSAGQRRGWSRGIWPRCRACWKL